MIRGYVRSSEVGDALLESQLHLLWRHAVRLLDVVIGGGRVAGEQRCFVGAVERRVFVPVRRPSG
jgi:hypothetical protein